MVTQQRRTALGGGLVGLRGLLLATVVVGGGCAGGEAPTSGGDSDGGPGRQGRGPGDGSVADAIGVAEDSADVAAAGPSADGVSDAMDGSTAAEARDFRRDALHRGELAGGAEDCDDGIYCNGVEVPGAEGCTPGDPVPTDDGIPCTVDWCDEPSRRVVHQPLDELCDDGDICNGEELCILGLGCSGGDGLATDDGIECTVDSCDPQSGEVVHEADDAQCAADGICVVGVCDPGEGCVATPVPTTCGAGKSACSACGPDGWCWQMPLPAGAAVAAVWMESAEHAWFGGSFGKLVEWTPDGFVRHPPLVPFALGSFSIADMLGVPEGEPWLVVYGPSSNTSEVHRKTDDGYELEFAGVATRLRAGAALDADHAVVVGHGGKILERAGGQWTEAASPTSANLRGVWAGPAGTVVAVGDDSVVLQREQGTWSVVEVAGSERLYAVDGVDGPEPIVVAAGEGGAVVTLTEEGWQKTTVAWDETFRAVAVIDSATWFVLGEEGVIRVFEEGSWQEVPSFSKHTVRDVDVATGAAIAVSEGGRIARFDQGAWTLTSALQVDAALFDVWGDDPDNVWAVGGRGNGPPKGTAVAMSWDGESWNVSPGTGAEPLYGVWVQGPNSVWAVGAAGTILQHKDTAWKSWTSPTSLDLRDVVGIDEEAWAVGSFGTILHFDGASWSEAASPTTAHLEAAWLNSATDIWAVGGDTDACFGLSCWGFVVHWDGIEWLPVPLGKYGAPPLFAVSGVNSQNVWIGGNDGYVAEWDGATWIEHSTPWPLRVDGLWASSPTEVLAVGEAMFDATEQLLPTLVRWDGLEWLPASQLPRLQFRAVARAEPGHTWVVGGNPQVGAAYGTIVTEVPCMAP